MTESIPQSNTNETIVGVDAMSRRQISACVNFGILFPLIALITNYIISNTFLGALGFDMLYMAGAMFLLPRVSYLYVTISSGILTLWLWLIFFRQYGKKYNGFIGGILFFNAVFYLAFGIAGVYRMLFIPIWLPPFCAAPILFLSGMRAIRIARSVMRKRHVVVTAIAGFLFLVLLSLFIVRQPWGLIKHLPNARGANLSGMDLSHIYIDGASGVNFEGANLSNADLSYAYLVTCDINMHKVNLGNANLSHANLSLVNLTDANLRDANLNDAQIYEVDFTGADLRGAILGFHAIGRINMDNANLCGADLRRIEHISGVYWKGAIYNSATLWPKDFDPAKEEAVFRK